MHRTRQTKSPQALAFPKRALRFPSLRVAPKVYEGLAETAGS